MDILIYKTKNLKKNKKTLFDKDSELGYYIIKIKGIRRLKMYFIYLTNRETKVSYRFDYCEDIHTEMWKNDIDIVFTSRGNRIVCSLREYDFRIEKEQEDEE